MLRFVWGPMFVWIGLTEAAFSLDENSGKVPFTIQLEMPGEKPRPSADAFVVVPLLKRVGHDSPLGSTTLFTASQYAVTPNEYVGFSSGAAGPNMAAYLCRRYTRETLPKMSEQFGLSYPDSASDLIRRGAKKLQKENDAIRHQKSIEKKPKLNPENQV